MVIMMEKICIFASCVGAWVMVDTMYDLKRYVGFLRSYTAKEGKKLTLSVVKRYDYGCNVRGYNVVFLEAVA